MKKIDVKCNLAGRFPNCVECYHNEIHEICEANINGDLCTKLGKCNHYGKDIRVFCTPIETELK